MCSNRPNLQPRLTHVKHIVHINAVLMVQNCDWKSIKQFVILLAQANSLLNGLSGSFQGPQDVAICSDSLLLASIIVHFE